MNFDVYVYIYIYIYIYIYSFYKNHYFLVLTFLSDRYLLIIHINSKDVIKCILNVNLETKLMRRQGKLILWLTKSILFI